MVSGDSLPIHLRRGEIRQAVYGEDDSPGDRLAARPGTVRTERQPADDRGWRHLDGPTVFWWFGAREEGVERPPASPDWASGVF